MGVFSVDAELADYDVGQTVLGVLAALVAWTSLYTFLCIINSKKTYEWNCRVVSTLHAIVVVVMTAWSGFVQGPWPFTDAGAPNTKLHHWTSVVCLGYFIYDLMWCLYFQTEGAVMLFHHLLSTFGQALIIFRGKNGVEMVATLFGSELSNPFLQMRWFLREANLHKTWYAEVNDHLFMILFGFLRIIIGSWLLYCTFIHPRPDWIAKLGGLAIYLLGWVFWIMIVNYAIRKYMKMYKAWEANKHGAEKQNSSADKHDSLQENGDIRTTVNANGVQNGHTHRVKQE